MKSIATFLGAAMLLSCDPVFAGEAPYTTAAFDQLVAARKPVAVEFHADWCPTCRAQAPVVRELMSTTEFKPLTVLVADFDTDKAARKSLSVSQQSTIVVFRQGKEVARSTGETHRDGLAALLHRALP